MILEGFFLGSFKFKRGHIWHENKFDCQALFYSEYIKMDSSKGEQNWALLKWKYELSTLGIQYANVFHLQFWKASVEQYY